MTSRRPRLRAGLYAGLCAGFLAATVPLAAVPTPAAALETIRTDSGLRYADETVGAGRRAAAGDVAIVHYTGWLYEAGDRGAQFDASTPDRPFSFRIGAGRVIEGWDEGVAGMRVGGKRTLIVPAELGYGARGAGDRIPPNADLMFEVELIDLR